MGGVGSLCIREWTTCVITASERVGGFRLPCRIFCFSAMGWGTTTRRWVAHFGKCSRGNSDLLSRMHHGLSAKLRQEKYEASAQGFIFDPNPV